MLRNVEKLSKRWHHKRMGKVNSEFIERYQILYERNPKSKVFAPLAEAYRKIGLTNKAYTLCLEGIKLHPDFSGGRVALARALIELKEPSKAIEQLEKATELSPENILAFSLLADTYLRLKKPKEALRAYKMVLFLSPHNKKAQKAVKKLESLTADEFEEEAFAMKKLDNKVKTWKVGNTPSSSKDDSQHPSVGTIERFLSLTDAFIVRNDLERAKKSLIEAQKHLGQHKEITKRLRLIQQRAEIYAGNENEPSETLSPISSRQEDAIAAKIKFLQDMLYKVSHRRNDAHK